NVIDTSGAYIPGHGTPTVILVGRRRRPTGDTIRAALGVRGEPGQPQDPSKGLVWTEIVDHISDATFNGTYMTITDLDRSALATHPWSLTGGGASDLMESLNQSPRRLCDEVEDIGFLAVTREDEAYLLGRKTLERRGVDRKLIRPMIGGTEVRDWRLDPDQACLCTYDADGNASIDVPGLRILWPLKQLLLRRRAL